MNTLSDPERKIPHPEMLDNLREQTALAEEMGYECIWLGEHHFGPYGEVNLPNPILLCADVAARTESIRM